MSVKAIGPLTIGLDIGIASVGWAVLAPNRIVDLGVRAFDAAEDKDRKPFNQTRRGARVARNRYHMRTWRLKRLVRLFRDVAMISKSEIKQLFSAHHPKIQSPFVSPWALRAEGLVRKLTPQEWAQVIYHIVKHRGFKFFSKTEDPQDGTNDETSLNDNKTQEQKEREGLRKGLDYTTRLLKRYPQFTTVGNVAFQLAIARQDNDGIYRGRSGERLDTQDCEEFQESFRNKAGSYRHAFRRDDLRDELAKLFDAQKGLGNPHIDRILRDEIDQLCKVQVGPETRQVGTTFRDQVFALLELQHPPITLAQMDTLIGDCELESEERNGKGKAERRAPKHSFSNERATWLQTLNNLRIKRNGKELQLSAEERAALINLPYTQSKVTFKHVREELRKAFGFPAHWREASFTKVSYRAKRRDDGSWINVVAGDGAPIPLGKFGPDDIRKKASAALKKRLETSTMTFAELRQLFGLTGRETFVHQRREAEIIPASLEVTYPIPFGALGKEVFIKLLPAKSKTPLTLKGKAMKALSALRSDNSSATLADLRTAIDKVGQLDAGWQFECSRKDSVPIQPADEPTTQIPIEYEDPQKAEEETLIELKGWHTLEGKLETSNPEWWANLQVAWHDPQSEAGQAAAQKIDEIADVLTKAQTDVDIADGLAKCGLNQNQIEALERIRFKHYRNLSSKALRKILPELEAEKSYKEACTLAGYELIATKRSRLLPPLETYLYERIRHDHKTGYKERRYKDLTNPVVARSFNQARLVLNALIEKYDQSPAYVHVELARDLAKSKERRDEDKRRQDENRRKRDSARANFVENFHIPNPTARQILKERLYQEQQCKCIYTLTELDPHLVVNDENYAQIDHVWPRSLTFDNSQDNSVLVHAHANQNKGDRIPFEFIMQTKGAAHWRDVEKWILSCKGMSDGKQKRLLSRELEADEFRARNLVDTRYATRLFARMVRDRLLFDGQVEDKTNDIDPSESGKLRLEKFHKTRVRTPQGRLTALLRRSWLGDIKNREASDRHHALDACIVAACTPDMIHKVNSYFANEEKVPNRFKKNNDGTYTDRCNGEIISKQEARDRGLFLPPPWEEFRKEFREKYDSIMVSRAARRKRHSELHDANPLAFRKLPVPLTDLSPEILTSKAMPSGFSDKYGELLAGLSSQLESHSGDAKAAFAEPYEFTDRKGKLQRIRMIALPVVALPEPYLKLRLKKSPKSKVVPESGHVGHKATRLVDLTLKKLDPKNLGETYYHRNKSLIDALKDRLEEFGGNAKKAFGAEKYIDKNVESDNKSKTRKDRPFNPNDYGKPGPMIRSIRLPESCGLGADIRGGIAKLGSSQKTEVHWTGTDYFFRNRYELNDEQIRGIPEAPPDGKIVFTLIKNDYVSIVQKGGEIREGYFVFYPEDGRMQVRRHDLPRIVDYVEQQNEQPAESDDEAEEEGQATGGKKKKKVVLAWRIPASQITKISKFKVGVLGDLTLIADPVPHGLA